METYVEKEVVPPWWYEGCCTVHNSVYVQLILHNIVIIRNRTSPKDREFLVRRFLDRQPWSVIKEYKKLEYLYEDEEVSTSVNAPGRCFFQAYHEIPKDVEEHLVAAGFTTPKKLVHSSERTIRNRVSHYDAEYALAAKTLYEYRRFVPGFEED